MLAFGGDRQSSLLLVDTKSVQDIDVEEQFSLHRMRH